MNLFICCLVIQISTNALHKLTTVLQTANALIWKDLFNANANRDLQEMGKHALVSNDSGNRHPSIFKPCWGHHWFVAIIIIIMSQYETLECFPHYE